MSIQASFQVTLGNFQLNASFEIPGSGVTALFGPSGCGKTTILRCIAGLQKEAKGFFIVNDEVWLDSSKKQFLPSHRRAVGYVFQEGSLLPHLSVHGNLNFGFARSGKNNGIGRFDEIVTLLGIEKLLDRSPERLSGGERQRVAIARSLLVNPRLILLDEPLSALDMRSRSEILPYLERIKQETRVPMIYVSHTVEEIRRLSDHVIVLDQGVVRECGVIEQVSLQTQGSGPPVVSLEVQSGTENRVSLQTVMIELTERGYRVTSLSGVVASQFSDFDLVLTEGLGSIDLAVDSGGSSSYGSHPKEVADALEKLFLKKNASP